MEEKSKYTKYLVSLFLLLVIVGVSSFFYKSRIVSYSFAGAFKSISGDSILATGSFSPAWDARVSKESRTVTIVINSKTRVIKVATKLPSAEELAKTGGYFDGRKLKREESTSDFETLKKDLTQRAFAVNIFATSSRNIYNKLSFTATEIKYEIIAN